MKQGDYIDSSPSLSAQQFDRKCALGYDDLLHRRKPTIVQGIQLSTIHIALASRRQQSIWPVVVLLGLGIVIGVGPTPAIVVLAGGGLLALGSLLAPAITLCLLALAIPFGLVYQIPVAGSQLGLPEVLLVLIVFIWGMQSLARRQWFFRIDGMAIAITIYAWVIGLSFLVAMSWQDTFPEFVKWIEVLLLYLAARELVKGPWRWVLVISLMMAGIAQSLLGIYQFSYQLGPEAFRLGGFSRAYGSFAQPNPYAGYLGLIAPLGISLTIWSLRHWWQARSWSALYVCLLIAIATAILAAGLLVSWSRGAWLGFLVATIVVIIIHSGRYALPIVAGSIIILLVFWAGNGMPTAVTSIADRMVGSITYLDTTNIQSVEITDENFANIERIAHWLAGLEMFGDHPWLGVGAGNYPAAYPIYALPRWQDALGHAHNAYINIAAETGIIGLVSYLILLATAFSYVWLRIKMYNHYTKAVAIGIFGVLVHLSVHNLFDNLFVQRLYLQVALLLALLGQQSKEPSSLSRSHLSNA